MKGYYFITDHNLSLAGNLSDVRSAVRAGVEVVQYRNKKDDSRRIYEEAAVLRAVCNDIIFLVNDRVDIALAVDADGVHLGREDLPYEVARKMLGHKRIIGLTVHNLKEALEAAESGADYVGVSPIFSTTTKQDAGKPAGVELIKEVKKNVAIPVVAVGGINMDNAAAVVSAGADALCAISAVVTKKDAETEMRKFQKLFVLPNKRSL